MSHIDRKSPVKITNIRRDALPKLLVFGNLNYEHKNVGLPYLELIIETLRSCHICRCVCLCVGEGGGVRLLNRPSFSFQCSGNRIWCGFLFFSPTLRVYTNVNKEKWRWAIVLTVSSPFIVGQPFDLMSEDGIR